jgi:hypothetical protein
MPPILHHDLLLDAVPRAIVDQDIRVFLGNEFSKIQDRFEKVVTNWPSEDKMELHVRRAEGLFIYASTVCLFIRSHDDWPPKKMLNMILYSVSMDGTRKTSRNAPRKSPYAKPDLIYSQILSHSLKNIEDLKKGLISHWRFGVLSVQLQSSLNLYHYRFSVVF